MALAIAGSFFVSTVKQEGEDAKFWAQYLGSTAASLAGSIREDINFYFQGAQSINSLNGENIFKIIHWAHGQLSGFVKMKPAIRLSSNLPAAQAIQKTGKRAKTQAMLGKFLKAS